MSTSIKGLGQDLTHAAQASVDARFDHLKERADLKTSAVASDKVKERQRTEIAKVSEDFETLFLDLVMRSMRKSVPKGGLVDGGNAEEIYRSMLDSEYTKLMASQRQTGIANSIEEFLLRAANDEAKSAERKPAPARVGPVEAPAKASVDKAAGLKAYLPQGLLSGEKSETIPIIPLAPPVDLLRAPDLPSPDLQSKGAS